MAGCHVTIQLVMPTLHEDIQGNLYSFQASWVHPQRPLWQNIANPKGFLWRQPSPNSDFYSQWEKNRNILKETMGTLIGVLRKKQGCLKNYRIPIEFSIKQAIGILRKTQAYSPLFLPLTGRPRRSVLPAGTQPGIQVAGEASSLPLEVINLLLWSMKDSF